jgi:muramidase (phage lysozyme)
VPSSKLSKKTPAKKTSKKPDKKNEQPTQSSGIGPIVLTLLTFGGVFLTLAAMVRYLPPLSTEEIKELLGATDYVASPLPLVMEGGDPHLRALMRTISAAESNTADPYRLLYGGVRVQDLSEHPDECVRIVNGPNVNNCTTAAGRYQFLTTTWEQEAKRYHPEFPGWYQPWKKPSFEPIYQDQVIYGWLSDPEAWGVDLAALLRKGEINQVLKRLSGTWTSLGYGIEDNSMSSLLPQIYDEMLAEELAAPNAQAEP